MTDYEKVCDFTNLYRAHKKARLGKRNRNAIINFEMDLSRHLTTLSEQLKTKSYRVSGYYSFKLFEPKERNIDALYYQDRVVMHCLCDEVLAPELDKKLIYDNAACRIGKGTHFAIRRLSTFIASYYKKYGTTGYFLKCDIRKYFDNIEHNVLKDMLKKNIQDPDVMALLETIINSHNKSAGVGIPLGNQTSQWFALLYLNPLDRLVKEKLGIKYYTRYMDDCILIHHDKKYLRHCLAEMTRLIENVLHLEFNQKTAIFPLKNGVNYLGWHFYLSETGKVIRKVLQPTKHRYKRKLRFLQDEYANGNIDLPYIKQVLSSYLAHLSHGHTFALRKATYSKFILRRKPLIEQ